MQSQHNPLANVAPELRQLVLARLSKAMAVPLQQKEQPDGRK